MHVLNIHERDIAADADRLAALLADIGSERDRLWPYGLWSAFHLDGPLAVGTPAGHGFIAYEVSDYVPGRLLRFRFLGPRGFEGHHGLEIEALSAGRTRLRHTVDMQATWRGWLLWSLLVRWLHDALVEDLLSRAQAETGATPEVRPWSLRVRLLRRALFRSRARPQPDALEFRTAFAAARPRT